MSGRLRHRDHGRRKATQKGSREADDPSSSDQGSPGSLQERQGTNEWVYPGKGWAEWVLEGVMFLIWGALLLLGTLAKLTSVVSQTTGLFMTGCLLGLGVVVFILHRILRSRRG